MNDLAIKEGKIITQEEHKLTTLTAQDVVQRTVLAQQIMKEIMKEGVHYGKIPGCGDKPVLLKPGAEKLCLTFQFRPQYDTKMTESDVNREIDWEKKDRNGKVYSRGSTKGYYKYISHCILIYYPSGIIVGEGIGICSNFERKFRIQDSYDIENTVAKMAEKRSLIAAVLIATATSDILTQDLDELLDNGVINTDDRRQETKQDTSKSHKSQTRQADKKSTNTGNGQEAFLRKKILAKANLYFNNDKNQINSYLDGFIDDGKTLEDETQLEILNLIMGDLDTKISISQQQGQ